MWKQVRAIAAVFAVAVVSMGLAARSGSGVGVQSESGTEAAEGFRRVEQPKVKLALNWKPEPQFGGFYTAQLTHNYTAAGLEVEIVPGGSGTPTVQMIDNGRVEFGIVSADELINLRSKGGDVVALFAVFQTNPQGLMTHASRNITSLKQLLETPGTVAWQAGLPYVAHLKKTYNLSKLRQVPYTGGLPFLRSEDFAQQCFVTSEPLMAAKEGKPVSTFLISESGYNPYTTVLVTRREFLQKNPRTVEALTRAVQGGWETYLADPKPTNDMLRKLNPAMDAETAIASAEAQKSLIETEETKANGLGSMTTARWKQIIDQLVEYKTIDKPVPAEECFVPLPPKQ